MTLNLTCPCCGRTLLDGFSRGEEHIISALARSEAPLTAPEIMNGSSMDILSFPTTMTKMKPKLEKMGLRVVNVTEKHTGRGNRARYRLQKIEAHDTPETVGHC
jgi:hypothetical protein